MFFKRKYKRNRASVKIAGSKFLSIFLLIFILMTYGFSNSYDKSWNFDWSGIRPQVKDSILKVKKYGRLITSNGEGNAYMSQIKTQRWLFKNIKTSELIYLTDFPDPNIKALSYNVLLRKKNNNKFSLLKKALKDTLSFVNLAGGCLIYDMHLGEYLLKHQLNFGLKRPRGMRQIEDELTFDQIKEIQKLYDYIKKNEDNYKQIVYDDEYPITDYNWD